LIVPSVALPIQTAFKIAKEASLEAPTWCYGMRLLWRLSHRRGDAGDAYDVLEWLKQLDQQPFPELVGTCLVAIAPSGALPTTVQDQLAAMKVKVDFGDLPDLPGSGRHTQKPDKQSCVLKNMSSIVRNVGPLELTGEVGEVLKRKRAEMLADTWATSQLRFDLIWALMERAEGNSIASSKIDSKIAFPFTFSLGSGLPI
jgi:hypothetical protein